MDHMAIRKQSKPIDDEDLDKYSKEELIDRIKVLSAHNLQLRNIISKSSRQKASGAKPIKPFDFSKYNFRHVALKILYLGWDYQGYVIQEDTSNTIEQHLFRALTKTCLIKDRSTSNYHRCGRTDKGVSAFSQVISIDVRSVLKEDDDGTENELNYCKVLNRVLPNTIQCVAWSPVDKEFSARFDCRARTYKYFFPKGQLDVARMDRAAKKFLGSHDLRNFCKMDVGNGVTEFVRTISYIEIKHLKDEFISERSMCVMQIKSKAFLWHEVRYIMGILFLIGQTKEEPDVIDQLLDVSTNPKRPEYNMADEVPLNLYFCEYDDVAWYYDELALSEVIARLNTIWTYSATKESMIKHMLDSLSGELEKTAGKRNDLDSLCLSENLIQGVKTKKYIPLMKRQKCDSLEDKIKHFTKRRKKL